MADPISIGLAASLAAGAVGGASSIMGGNAAASASGYQAQVARINAQVARTNRDQTLTAGANKAEAYGIGARQTAGKIVTAQAGSGLDLNSGSFQRVRASQGAAASKDITSIYDNTARQAYGFETEAFNKEASGKMLDAHASSEKRAGMMKGLTTILGAASTVSGRWMDAKRSGALGGGASEEVDPWEGMREVTA